MALLLLKITTTEAWARGGDIVFRNREEVTEMPEGFLPFFPFGVILNGSVRKTGIMSSLVIYAYSFFPSF